MYHRSVLCLLYILVIVTVFQQVHAQCGNFGYITPNGYYNSTQTFVTTKSQVFRIGVVGSFAVVGVVRPMTTVLSMALDLINNNSAFLPDIRLEYQYLEVLASESKALTATNSAITFGGIRAMIGGAGVPETKVTQLLCRLNDIPQMIPLTFSASLSNKAELPMLGRLFPQAAVHCKAIAQYIKNQGWRQFALLYTDDDAGMSAYQIMGSTVAAYNITLFPFVISSATKNYTDIVAQMKTFASTYRLRVFVHYVIVNNTSFYGSMASAGIMNNPKYVNILAYHIASFVNANYKSWSNWVNGTVGIVPRAGNGPVYENMKKIWNEKRAADPLLEADPQINWYFFDSVYAIATALDNVIKSGLPLANVTGKTLMSAIKKVTFIGVTGNVTFDSDVERNGDLSFYNFGKEGTQNNTNSFGFYDFLNDSVLLYRSAQYSGLTTLVSDGVCECQYGTCIGDTDECKCYEGFTGVKCDIHNPSSAFSTTNKIIVAVVPVVIVVIMGIAAFWFVKVKRASAIKEVAQRQRSNINREDIVLATPIGRGASGVVYRATLRGTEVAVKQILTESVSKEVVNEFELESAVMASLRHPNIVIFMGACIVPAQREMLLVMEFMDKGSLNDVLHNPQINIPFELGLHIACQAAKGMNFLHQSSPPIIHRDLKSHNILLDDKWNAKIADFGIALIKESTKPKQDMKSIGTVYWTAPEVLQGEPHTEKSDCYSFGLVLWEIVHHINPYANRDPMAVAIGVTVHKLRPPMTATMPPGYRALIEKCWAQSPDDRPNFLEITQTLRQLSISYPLLNYQAQNITAEAPIGSAYFVHTNVTGGNLLWDKVPNEMEAAMNMHNQLIRETLSNYEGYEVEFSDNGFLLAFENSAHALNFCFNIQISLMNVAWPAEIVSMPYASTVEDETGARVWSGLRVQMGINSGVSNSSVDENTNKTIYFGPVVDKTKKLLNLSTGSILVTAGVMEKLLSPETKFTEEFTHTIVGKLDNTDVYSLIPNCLLARNATQKTPDLPHMIVDIDEPTTYLPPADEKLTWVVKNDQLKIKESIGKGAIGDYYSATYNGKEVALKVLVNQRLGETDLLHLKAKMSILTKLKHKNLLDVYGVCFEPGHISLILEYMPNCCLSQILANDSISLPWSTKLKIAKQIAEAMAFLSQFPDKDLNTHGNLKSGNVLVNTSKMEVKVTDHGQSSLKDLARTMTSVGTIAWTAPEILNGEEITPAITKYSFGIVLFEIASRKPPYPINEHPVKLVSKILKGYRPSNPGHDCPAAYIELMEACWSASLETRPSWSHIVNELDSMIASPK